jgi:hypothetical protein
MRNHSRRGLLEVATDVAECDDDRFPAFNILETRISALIDLQWITVLC